MKTTIVRTDEFDDLVELLSNHAIDQSAEVQLLGRIIAHACLGENHLWQDLGLPERQALNHLMRDFFPTLHALNTGNMRWKKFFYRQLCEKEQVLICKSPSCGDCCDYAACFGPEEEAVSPSYANGSGQFDRVRQPATAAP
ncbi:MAG: nitrogen fixation protein NifQ [Betaproteobacteria bacterium]|nr:nitrogen fixation protein NifQ [Betaproteobacteria bacterium]